jgi:hypothetical protein
LKDQAALTPKKMVLSFAASVKTRHRLQVTNLLWFARCRTLLRCSRRASGAVCRQFVSTDQMAIAQRSFQTVGHTVVVV